MLAAILGTTIPLTYLVLGIIGGRKIARALAMRISSVDRADTLLFFWLLVLFWPAVVWPCLFFLYKEKAGRRSLSDWIMNGQTPRRNYW